MQNEKFLQDIDKEIRVRHPELTEANVEISCDSSFDVIGLDSLTVVDLLILYSEKYDVDIETALEGIDPPKTVGNLVEIVAKFANGGT